jgi:oligosaccharide reducing-end xylanase
MNLQKSCSMPDYASFDGTPQGADEHKDFRSDARPTRSSLAVDHVWFVMDPRQVVLSDRVLKFLSARDIDSYPNQFTLAGEPLLSGYSTGLAAMAALAADLEIGKPFVQKLRGAQISSGKWRSCDSMLHMLAMLHASGNYKIYIQG